MKKYRKLHDFYIEESEEDLLKHIIPEYYIEQNINNIDVGYAARFLQNELNFLLNSFLNGGFSYKGFVFYPLIKGVSKDNVLRLGRLRKIAEFLDNNGYDFSKSIKNYNNKISSSNFALILSSLYRDFSLIKAKNTKSIKKPKCSEFDLSEYNIKDLKYLKPLEELKNYASKNLKQYLSGCYLHGSLVTKDYVRGWSDVDTLSIVSKKTINNPKSLLALRDRLYLIRHYFYKIDILQHHGSMIISEYDLDNYCQPYFPLPIFKYAKSFFKDIEIDFKARDFSGEALQRLFRFVSYFRKMNAESRFNLSSYETKDLLHTVTLFPAMYLQAKGMLMYKKFSFDIAKKDFDKEKWKIIDKVSLIRSSWKSQGNFALINYCSKINPVLYCQLNSWLMDLFKDIKKYNNIGTGNIVKDMYALSETAWSNLKENAKEL